MTVEPNQLYKFILELYEFVLPEYASHDGLHYDTVTYCRIYNEIIRLLAAS